MGKLDGKVAVVTGASSGIGRSTALALAAEGCAVALCGRKQDALDGVVQAIASKGGKAFARAMNVTNERDFAALIDGAVSQYGRLDILVNNAGLSYAGNVAGGKTEEWREMLETNILALLIGCREAVRVMSANEPPRGHIVNVSSNATRHDIAATNSVYAATKHAVNAIGEGLRAELREQAIRVTTVLPGMTLTNFARNWPLPVLEGAARFVGIDPEKEPIRQGEYLPQDAVDRTLRERPGLLLSPDDLANAIVYAVTQPPGVLVDEVLVRPAQGLNIPM
jgi:NADP-dependent 3-hydroxy acid dehydrogenase YdfG